MRREPERNPHARPGAFNRPDAGGLGTEVEVSTFIGHLVRMLAPRVVVETGAGNGDTTLHIAYALGDNANRGVPGQLWTFETDPDRAQAVARLVDGTRTTVVQASIRRWSPPLPIDLAFVDSAYQTRVEDIERIGRYLAPQAVVLVHDVAQAPMSEALAWMLARYTVLQLATPRGLAMLQAPADASTAPRLPAR